MTAVAVKHDPVSHGPSGRPAGRPLDIAGLAGWPLPVGRIDFDEGLAFPRAVEPGGYTVWIIDPQVSSVTVHRLGHHGVHEVVDTIRGDDRRELTEPFPVTVRPADLLL
ncbi:MULTISPECIES: hypothetical protein [Protofrankia]|uniref:Uncharacterized protein n=1 Tax=Candidatus Protofrankia datiscae TaxID=2716812 RepID=F8B0M8_9ACTN|nr:MULTISPECIES: hypothetical protein [Protofrankia]AEH10660.1 hypothetical protein FsymDg_3358 [Candidatus Protofrankia datiscae]